MRVTTLVVFTVFCLLTPAAQAAPESITGEHDIGALLKQADKAFDVDDEDAIHLLNEFREDWTADGRRVWRVHRIVLIRTALGIRRHADLRIPYDAERQRFSVSALRTWRLTDARWIESGPTAQVETLPFAVQRAPDYAHHREMMLLHDGVELPCVVETAYTIEEIEPQRAGSSGSWLFPDREPTLISRLVLGFAPGAPPAHVRQQGVEAGSPGHDGATALDTLTFEGGPFEPLPHPMTAEAARRVAHVEWSSWPDWAALGADLAALFTTAAQLGETARDGLTRHLEPARIDLEKAGLVAEYLAQATRPVRYAAEWWPAPRSAQRIWETAYGHRLDRAVLAAALFREAGLQAELAFRSRGYDARVSEVPTLSWFDGAGVWVSGEGFKAWFDAADSTLSFGSAALHRRLFWRPGSGHKPYLHEAKAKNPARHRVEVRLDLSYDAENEQWKGTGVLAATGALSPFNRMTGFQKDARGQLGRLVGSILEGAKVTAANPALFTAAMVSYGFEVELPQGDRDSLERLKIGLGDPGLLDPLLDHASVHLHDEQRGSAVVLPAPVEQHVELRLDPGQLELIRLPRTETIANEAGRCVVSAASDDDGITLARVQWPGLRALLLADAQERNRLVVLK
jgi:hypothetical protein